MSFPPVDDGDALHRLPPHVLEKAAGRGRMRGVALEAWQEARRDPRRAGRALRDGVRNARALHSRERRLVREALFGMVRGHARWEALLHTDRPEVLWLAQLVEAGLDVARARAEVDADYDRVLMACAPGPEASAGDLAAWFGLPDRIVADRVDAWGREGALAWLTASDRRAPVTLRANLAVVRDREAAAERLRREGIETVPGRHAATALHVVGRANLAASRAFRDGVVEVQDEGSQCLLAQVPDVARIWDMCGGAGGKALGLAARGAEVLVTDVRGGALAEARRRAQRARVALHTERLGPDGSVPDAVAAFRPDAVLVDAPCSGTGVLRRHPEHRWLLDDEALEALPILQGQILDRAAPHVPVGGVLVYGTCSVWAEENERVVEAFLARHPAFHPAGPAMRRTPHEHGTDGFFAQALSRSHPLQSTDDRAGR